MDKGKLEKFVEMETFRNVFQYSFSILENVPFDMKSHWCDDYFKNNHLIVLELGCDKGGYTVGLAGLFPDVNFIGVDIKGARMWIGAEQALTEGLDNVAFLRTNIEMIDRLFALDEVREIWLTFSDPQMKNARKRLSSTFFMNHYRRLLVDGGMVHLKADSNFLFTYTSLMMKKNQLPLLQKTADLYHTTDVDEATRRILSIQTYYGSMWMERGLSIKYIKFRLPHEGQLEDPDVEIPPDDYRNYHRSKRNDKAAGK